MSTDTTSHQKYYVPESSSIPIVFAIAMLFFGVGAADAVMGKGTTLLFIGVATVLYLIHISEQTIRTPI